MALSQLVVPRLTLFQPGIEDVNVNRKAGAAVRSGGTGAEFVADAVAVVAADI